MFTRFNLRGEVARGCDGLEPPPEGGVQGGAPTQILGCIVHFHFSVEAKTASQEESHGVYIVYMGAKGSSDDHLQLMSYFTTRRENAVVHSYKHSLSEAEAQSIVQHPGVVSVFPDPIFQLHTTRSWDFMRYQYDLLRDFPYRSGSNSTSSNGADTIIGIFDTGMEYGLNQRVSMTRVSVQSHRDGKELAPEVMTSKLPAATEVTQSGQKPPLFNIESGTSMSCAQFSAIVATLKSQNPSWSLSAIRSAIMTTGHNASTKKLISKTLPKNFSCRTNSSDDSVSNMNYPSIAVSLRKEKPRKLPEPYLTVMMKNQHIRQP
ncbi:hypothetical protein BC332_21387 [Capsicum chinense]|nr:hypothetical protein BC332_21387 [Capsicum chinense]